MLVDGYHLVQDLERSHGVWLYDAVSEREVLDLYGHFSTNPLGFNHPRLRDPDFLRRFLPAALQKPANSDVYTVQLAEFVRTFARVVPERFRRHLFFIEGGALAVENALKVAFDWKVRKNLARGKGELGTRILHFREAFHGRSGYTLSLTNTADPRKTQYFPKFDWPRIVNPKLRFPLSEQSLQETIATERQAISEIESALRAFPDDIAGLIIEPIQGEGGDNHFRGEFLAELRRLADAHEFLLIFDEVQSGFGTTGRWWAFEHFGVEPDVFAFAKKTQVAGIAAGPRVDEVDSVFKVSSRINSTWGGHLGDMVRCQRIIEVIEEDRLLEQAARVGNYALDRLWSLAKEFPDWVSNVRGRGLMLAFDLPNGEVRQPVIQRLQEEAVLILPSGARSVRMRPPLVITEAEIDFAVEKIRAVVSRLSGRI
jgi:L-lysine 6-transaminase